MNKFQITNKEQSIQEILAEYFVIEKELDAVLFCNGPYYGPYPQIRIDKNSYGLPFEKIIKTDIVAYISYSSIVLIRKLND